MDQRICLFGAGALTVAASMAAAGTTAGLRLWDTGANVNTVWTIDTAAPAAVDPVYLDTDNAVADFEYGLGKYYAASTNDNTQLFVLDPANGMLLNTVVMSFPDGGNVITSMEFVGGTLYGGFATESGATFNSSLVTIDVNTGAVTMIGDMGIVGPTGGLAWNGSAMYTVNSGASGSAMLYSVDLGSGNATIIDDIVDASGAVITLTGLEFGLDGVLYGLGRGPNENMLYSIDTETAMATAIGLLNSDGQTTSLTTVPAPASLLALGTLGLMARRRRS